MDVDWSRLREVATRASSEEDLYEVQMQAGLSYTRRQTAAYESMCHALELQDLVARRGGGCIALYHGAQEMGICGSRAAVERAAGSNGANM